MTKEELAKRDYILLLDKSSSMLLPLTNGKSRWDNAKEVTIGFASKCAEFDSDGITIIPFAGTWKKHDNITNAVEKINQIFTEHEPNGSTNTGGVLKFVFDDYNARKKADVNTKPITVLCVTDGEPTVEKDAIDAIVNFTKTLEKDEDASVSFFQIGNDAKATAFLKMLDDDLMAKYNAKFDIVDTKTSDELENMTLTEALIASIED